MSSLVTTHLTQRLLLTLVMVVTIAGIYLLMRRGWLRQVRNQVDIHTPPALADHAPEFHGVYVSTTFADQPLRRIVAHGLGTRSSVEIAVTTSGIDLFRQGAPSFSIPRSLLLNLSRSSGMVGKFVGTSSLIVITWRLGDVEVDTGLLVGAKQDDFVARVESLL